MLRPLPALTVLAGLSLAAAPSLATGQCDVRREVDRSLDAAGISGVLVQAEAGRLEITGGEHTAVRVHGVLCASDESVADRARLVVEARRGAAWIETDLPDGDGWNDAYARMDLVVEIPARLPVDVRDGSGEIVLRSIAAVHIDDGSGAIDVEDVAGPVEIEDGSGDLRIVRAGSVVVDDGSGSIEIAEVEGSVRIIEDGSGGIDIRDVGGDVTIEEDGSGGIRVVRVGGDFVLEDDGSGSVTHSEVQGRVVLPSER